VGRLTQPGVYPNAAPGRLAANIRALDPLRVEPLGASQPPEALGRRVAIMGLADDTGVGLNGGRVGAREGPAAFRAALARYGHAVPMDFPSRGLSLPEVFDAGDIVPADSLEQTHDRVTTVALALLNAGFLPVGIGGGHDLTFPLVRALLQFHASHDQRDWPPPNGVYVDPHLDVRPEPGSGMAFRALLEQTGLKSLVNIGANPLVNSAEHYGWFIEHGGRVEPLPAPDGDLEEGPSGDGDALTRLMEDAWFVSLDLDALDASVAPLPAPDGDLEEGPSGDGDALTRLMEDAWFVSLDLDALDASVAPGVSAPNPEGLSSAAMARIAHAAGASLWVGSFDLMELNPRFDVDGRTARVAAHLFLSFLRGVAERLTGPGIDWP